MLGTVLWISRGLAHYSVSDLSLSLSLSIYLERVSFHTPRNKLLYLKSLITARIRFLRYTAMRIFPSFRKNGHTLIFFLPVKCCPPIFYHYLIVYFLIFFPPSLSLYFSFFRNVTQRSRSLLCTVFGRKKKEMLVRFTVVIHLLLFFFFGFYTVDKEFRH